MDGWPESEGRSALHVVPRERRGGFRTWIGYENNNSQWDCYVHGHDGGGEKLPPTRLAGYETDAVTDLLISYLYGRAGPQGEDDHAAGNRQPFFAVLSVQPPHGPYLAPAEDMARHSPARVELRPNVPPVGRIADRAQRELAGYYAMIENLDSNVGRVREALADTGLDRDTHVLFFSDHGDCHGSHGYFDKSSPWEESIRIPLILGGREPFDGRPCGRFGRPSTTWTSRRRHWACAAWTFRTG